MMRRPPRSTRTDNSVPTRRSSDLYEVAELKHPRSAIVDSTTFNAGWAVLALLLAGFFGLGRIGVPISAVAGAGALVLLGVAARGHRISTRKVIREAPWQVVVFSLGMYLVVYGLRNEGLTDHRSTLLDLFGAIGKVE